MISNTVSILLIIVVTSFHTYHNPLGYVCLESGWIVAEMGRQPWVIQDIMPTFAAISNIEVASVQTTFWMFAVLFTVLLIAEVGIMLKQIKKGTEQK